MPPPELRAVFALGQGSHWSPWHDTVLWELAEANLMMGRLDDAHALFAESSSYAAGGDNTDSVVICESELALLAMDRGLWDDAADHLRRGEEERGRGPRSGG